jgi:dCMP deaminase
MREELKIPRGERYEMCRSVHAEANAIINAPRTQMLGATLYMACVSPVDGHLFDGTSSCMMCKKMIINAGIERVVIRDNNTDYRVVMVSEWIEDDDSLSGKFGY